MVDKRLIIWGAGTLGRLIGAQWQGKAVGYTKTDRQHDALRATNIIPRTGSPIAVLRSTDLLLLSLPGHARQHDAIKALQAGNVRVARAVVISSTGYFGQQTGRITLTTPADTSSRAQAIAAMEQAFRNWIGANGVILRPGGLYNAVRGPFQAFKRRKTLPNRPLGRTLALVHYDDVATAALNAFTHPDPHPAYNVVTPPCPTRHEFYSAAAAVLNLTLPVITPLPTDQLVDYDVGLLRRDLLPDPAYPAWRSIFSAINDSADSG